MVIPLRTEAAFDPQACHLNPVLAVANERLVLDTATLGAVPLAELRRPCMRLVDGREAVQQAPDTLFGAY